MEKIEDFGMISNLGLSNCLFVPCPRYLPSHRCAELPQRGSLGTAENTCREMGFLEFGTKGSPSGGAPAAGG